MTATMLVLEPIFEADLLPEQYAYRPGRYRLPTKFRQKSAEAFDVLKRHSAAKAKVFLGITICSFASKAENQYKKDDTFYVLMR